MADEESASPDTLEDPTVAAMDSDVPDPSGGRQDSGTQGAIDDATQAAKDDIAGAMSDTDAGEQQPPQDQEEN